MQMGYQVAVDAGGGCEDDEALDGCGGIRGAAMHKKDLGFRWLNISGEHFRSWLKRKTSRQPMAAGLPGLPCKHSLNARRFGENLIKCSDRPAKAHQPTGADRMARRERPERIFSPPGASRGDGFLAGGLAMRDEMKRVDFYRAQSHKANMARRKRARHDVIRWLTAHR